MRPPRRCPAVPRLSRCPNRRYMNMASGASESGLSSTAKSRLLSSIHIMVNFVRSANWTSNKLFAFNIAVQPATPAALPGLSVSVTILDNFQEPNGPLSKTDRKFFQYMQVAECAGFEPVTSDYTVFLLSLLDYDHDTRLLRTKNVMPLYMARQRVEAKADVVLMDGNSYLLVVQEEKGISQLAVASMAPYSWYTNLAASCAW